MVTRVTRVEQRERTRAVLVDAAEALFTGQGFHATSVDAVAAHAGFTKGAVYSNFASKEDLFFAVYERRADAFARELEELLEELPFEQAIDAATTRAARRRGREDGWIAVFFEFWAHVVRHPEHRARFARIHARAAEPFVAATERLARERDLDLPVSPREWAIAMLAMQFGISLELLVQPDVVDGSLGLRMNHHVVASLQPRGRRDA
jgi:AcrR family transcriptional regulator